MCIKGKLLPVYLNLGSPQVVHIMYLDWPVGYLNLAVVLCMTVFLFDIQQLNQDAFQIKPFMLLTLEDTVIYGETD